MLVYADAAATTKLSESALTSMLPFLKGQYANPSSSHIMGQGVREAIDAARELIASCINAEPDEIYFTSGGTEADNWAMRIASEGNGAYLKGIYVSNMEHKAILNLCGGTGVIMADNDGIVYDGEITSCMLHHKPRFVSVMLANNEIGTLMPIRDCISDYKKVLHRMPAYAPLKKLIFHTDAVQAVGHIPVDVKALGVDMLSASGHKFHGPKGVGFLYVRNGVNMSPLLYGGHQERGVRAGTENVAGIVGMATALCEAVEYMDENTEKVTMMRDKLISGLSEIPGAILNGHPTQRVPGIVNFCFDGVDGETLVMLLSERGIMASSGSACMSGDRQPSHVLKAIGRTDEQAMCALRLSIDETNTPPEIDYILRTVPECVSMLRAMRT